MDNRNQQDNKKNQKLNPNEHNQQKNAGNPAQDKDRNLDAARKSGDHNHGGQQGGNAQKPR